MVNAEKENAPQKEQKLDMFLRQLRILARVQLISWDHLQQYMQDGNADNSEDESGAKMQEYREVRSSIRCKWKILVLEAYSKYQWIQKIV